MFEICPITSAISKKIPRVLNYKKNHMAFMPMPKKVDTLHLPIMIATAPAPGRIPASNSFSVVIFGPSWHLSLSPWNEYDMQDGERWQAMAQAMSVLKFKSSPLLAHHRRI